MSRKVSLQEIESFPDSILQLTEEVSSLIEDVRKGSAALKASQIPLFLPRIEFLKKKLDKKRTEAQAMIDDIPADDRFNNGGGMAAAALRQQLVIINNDISTLDEMKNTLKEAGNKLSEVKLL